MKRHPVARQVLVAAGVMTATLAISAALRTAYLGVQSDRMLAETRVVQSSFAARLDSHLAARLNTGRLLSQHIQQAEQVEETRFRTETALFHELFGDLQALNWVDPEGVIRIVTPKAPNAAAQDLDLRRLELPSRALAEAARTGALQVTPPITLAQGGTGFVAYLPIGAADQRQGFLNMVFRAEPLMRSVLGESPIADFGFRVIDEGRVLYASRPDFEMGSPVQRGAIRVGTRTWMIEVAPVPGKTRASGSYVDGAIVLFGVLISLLTGGLTYLTLARQNSLKESQARFQDFAHASSDWFWEMDADLRVIWFSEGIEDFFGVPREEFLGRARGDFRLASDDEEKWARHAADLAARRPFKDFDYPITARGHEKWVRTSGTPFYDTEGRFLGYRGIASDITDAVRTRAYADQADKFLSDAVEGLNELFSLWDKEDRLVFGNRKFREINSDIAEFIVPGTPFRDFLSAAVAAGHMSGLDGKEEEFLEKSLARRQSPAADPFEVTRSDGVVLLLHEQRFEGLGIVTVGLDVTKLHENERALRASEERLALAVQQISIWDWDIETDDLYLSPGFAVALGYSEQEFREIKRASVATIIHPDDLEGYRQRLSSHLNDPDSGFSNEHRFRMKSGAYRWFLARGHSTRDETGKAVRSNGVLTDITERVELEERLHHAQKMEAIGQLTGGVAHDFNNLLAVVMGNAELLDDRVDDRESAAFLDAIKRASRRGAELTQRLLAFSMRQPLSPTEVDVCNLVRGLPALLAPVLGETIALVIEDREGVWPAHADAGQIENALLNLAINSRDAMPDGGRVVISCDNASFAAPHNDREFAIEAGDYVVISVTDTGTGMSEATLDHAFEPFFTTKGVGKGSGLGLSMVMGFAKQSGGQVAITSDEGRGTEVRLYLPRAVRSTGRARSVPAPDVPRGEGETLLLIEDDEALRNLTNKSLSRQGYKVVAAAHAAEARAALAKHPEVALILSDVVLPGGVSGPAFVREVRRNHPEMKVVFMSGYPSEALAEDGRFATDDILLGKPFAAARLASVIREVLLGRGGHPTP